MSDLFLSFTACKCTTRSKYQSNQQRTSFLALPATAAAAGLSAVNHTSTLVPTTGIQTVLLFSQFLHQINTEESARQTPIH
jgi:hypothetical protein